MSLFKNFISASVSKIRQDIILISAIFGIAFFLLLGNTPLMEPDEGRYAEIPREMLEKGDFITPTLNYVKYFEKPPLHYWLNALSMSIFGENEFAVRFPGALCGLLTVIAVYWLGRKLFGSREGLLAAIILGSATGFVMQGRINLTDMTLTFFMTACIGCFLLASRPEDAGKGFHYHLFYLFSALAFLAKGLIGFVLPGGIIFLYMLFCRKWFLLGEMRLITGLPLFLAVSAPWPVMASVRNPEFFNFFFIHEHFTRFLTKVHGRYEPFWFFIPIFLLTMLPWSFFAPHAITSAWRSRKNQGGDTLLFLVIWAGFIFLFFSKSNSKLIPYILPLFPPIALLTANFFTRMFDGSPIPKKTATLLAALLVIAGGVCTAYPHLSAKPLATASGGAVVGVIFVLQGLSLYLAVSGRDCHRIFSSLAMGGIALSLAAPITVLPEMSKKKGSSRELCRMVKSVAKADTAVVSVGYEQGLPFYAERRVITAGRMGELEFGAGIGDQSEWFMEKKSFPALWDSGRDVVALITRKDLESMKTAFSSPVTVLGEDSRRVLVTNRLK